jgi:hypothetical protein
MTGLRLEKTASRFYCSHGCLLGQVTSVKARPCSLHRSCPLSNNLLFIDSFLSFLTPDSTLS